MNWTFCVFSGVSSEALLAQLHTLDSHSALHILHTLTPLAQYEERKILDLLQQQTTTPQAGAPSPPRSVVYSRKAFRTQPPPPPAGVAEATVALSPAARRNIVLFQGFCAIKYAIYALCVNAHHSTSCSRWQSKQHLHKHERDKADAEETSASSEGQS